MILFIFLSLAVAFDAVRAEPPPPAVAQPARILRTLEELAVDPVGNIAGEAELRTGTVRWEGKNRFIYTNQFGVIPCVRT